MIDRKPWAWVLAFFLLALAWRLFNTGYGDTYYDGFGCIMIARSILAGGFATPYIADGILYHHDFLYPFIIAVFSAFVGDLFLAARVANAVAGALLVVPVHGLTRDVFGPRPAIYASALVVFHPFLSALSSNAYSEPLYLLFGVTGIWWLWRAWNGRSLGWAVGAGVLFGLATLVRQQGFALVASVVCASALAHWVRRAEARRRAAALAVAVAVFAIVVAPLVIHLKVNRPHGAGSKLAQEMLKKNAPFGEEEWFQRERSLTADGTRLAWHAAARENGVVEWTSAHPGIVAKRAALEFFTLIRDFLDQQYLPLLISIPVILQIVHDGRRRRSRRGFWMFAPGLALATFASVALVAVSMQRYLAVLAPVLIVIAGAGLDTLSRGLNEVLRRDVVPARVFRAIPYVLLVLALGSYTRAALHPYGDDLPPPDDTDRRVFQWAEPFLDPGRREIIMSTTPAVPGLSGDTFFLLPMDTPDRVARYALAQSADFVLIDEWYLGVQDPATQQLWNRANLESLGLVRLDRISLQRTDRIYERRILFRVVPPSTEGSEGSGSVASLLDRRRLEIPGESLGARIESNDPPHVILLSIDTLRADHLGAYGYSRRTSPFLDELSAAGIRFGNVISQSPQTAPSHMSVFTGLYPHVHGARFDEDEQDRMHGVPLSANWTTLPELFQRAGYRTAAWTGGGQVSSEIGFSRGFETFNESIAAIRWGKLELVRNWFQAHSGQPCFLFIHTYQVHDPYTPPAPYDTLYGGDYDGWVIGNADALRSVSRDQDFLSLHYAFWRRGAGEKVDVSRFSPADLQRLIDLYDGGIRFTDSVIATFIENLVRDGLMDNTLLVVMSDHGEEFLEHGYFLHQDLYRETLHVPLILFHPGLLGGGHVVESQVELFDLAPTLLELAGLEVSDQVQSRSLLPLLEVGNEEEEDRPAYSEEPWFHGIPHHSLRADGVMLYQRGDGGAELFETAIDPLETTNVAERRPDLLTQMLRRLAAHLANPDLERDSHLEPPIRLSEEDLKRLRELGYVE